MTALMASPILLMGKVIREKILADVERECAALGFSPRLMSVRVGSDESADIYMNAQKKACDAVGARHERVELPEASSTSRVAETIAQLNRDAAVDGIIIQMPLPKQVDAEQVLAALDPHKDAEGVHPYSLGLLFMNKAVTVPCTPAACVELIKQSGLEIYGKEVVVVGASVAVGRPISLLLLDQMATVTMCRSSASKVGSLESHVRRADVLVAALGQPEAIRGKWIKEGAVVIDVGITSVHGKMVGDVEFEEAKKHARAITPVPGGVGPATTAILMRNLMAIAKRKQKKDRA